MSLLDLDNNFDNFNEELIVNHAIRKFLYNYELYNLKCYKSRIDSGFRIEIIGMEIIHEKPYDEIILETRTYESGRCIYIFLKDRYKPREAYNYNSQILKENLELYTLNEIIETL